MMIDMTNVENLKVGDWVRVPDEPDIVCARIVRISGLSEVPGRIDSHQIELSDIVRKTNGYKIRQPHHLEKLTSMEPYMIGPGIAISTTELMTDGIC